MKKQFGWFQTLIFQAKNGRLDKEKLEFGARKTKKLFEEQKRTEPMSYHLDGVIPPGHSDEESLRAMLTPLIAMLS